MHTTHPTSLLVAALVMLRHPCPRNQATAQLLLERVAENKELTPSEREACLNLADDLYIERPDPNIYHASALTTTGNPFRRHARGQAVVPASTTGYAPTFNEGAC